jgi:hypothetical protein
MKGLYQNIKITLVESPSCVADIKPFDGSDYFAFDSPSPASFDYPEKGRTEAKIRYAPRFFRLVRQDWNLFQRSNFLLQLW